MLKKHLFELIDSKVVRWVFTAVLGFEVLSYIAWLYPQFAAPLLLALLSVLLIATYKQPSIILYAIFVELVIGSHGYGLALSLGGFPLSLRMGLFIIALIAFVVDVYRSKQLLVRKSFYFPYLLILAAVLILAFLRGVLQNGAGIAFNDVNGYAFFLLAIPLWQLWRSSACLSPLLSAIAGALIASVVKILFILYTFSHAFWWVMPNIYRWVRDTRVGEITEMTELFFRIFFASQLWHAIGLIVGAIFLFHFIMTHRLKNAIKMPSFWYGFAFTVLMMTSTLVSLSRSNWVGLAGGGVVFAIMLLFLYRKTIWRSLATVIGTSFMITLSSFVLITGVVLFPLPAPSGDFSAASLFRSRVNNLTGGEAAVDSRWGLLPPMVDAIKEAPLLGHGFGKELTYITKDPRILERNPSGEYTTHAFEWGYLEIVVKTGLLGALVYGFFVLGIISRSLILLYHKRGKYTLHELWVIAFFIAGIVVLTTHVFSPYLNHPLGISYLLIWAFLTEKLTKPGNFLSYKPYEPTR